MGSQQGDDLQLNGDLACQNAEVRGRLTVGGSVIGGGEPAPTYVYRPGGVADSNVYTDWSLLMAALDNTRELGLRVLQFDSTFQNPATIPAGVWNMTNVRWYGIATQVEILDGAKFVWDPVVVGDPLEHVIEGFALSISYNGTGPITPFEGINVLCTGNFVRFNNQNPLAKPMFKSDGFNIILFSGEQANGGIQNYPWPVLAAPVLDCNGNAFFIFGGAGVIANNFATDLSGGPAGVVFGDTFNAFYGDFVNGFYDQWHAPALEAAGGAVGFDVNRASVRYRVNPNFLGVPIVPAMSPYPAAYNEFVPVDVAGAGGPAPVVIEAPSAQRSFGERFTVKDAGGNVGALGQTITVVSTYGDTIDDPVINVDGGAKTWVCWGPGVWSRI